ncbi:RsmB/NOP family class I SAM-dependent RNA methyltransferase [Anaeromyxobacter oryzisoli]|uniref:RsmB/NOP family class I SAM-dependent RNA methyltransferase n=1 Tax=Anaeromyxobacter oryzisoli TaxID=2925408 RepID=UPI001F583DD1|nr:RsmB/NOP family class I SAM-dependent RNA methyltransferase [Anaeromyxobacter sp. SG63]
MILSVQPGSPPHPPPAERRVAEVPWEALASVRPPLDAALAEVLAGAPAERIVDRALRDRRSLDRAGRAAAAEALFGVGLWRRRLRAQLGAPDAPPPLLLAALLRDLGGRTGADAERLSGLASGALPPPRPPPEDLADRWSLPDWLAAELRLAAGDDAAALAEALARPGPICLRANTLRAPAAAIAARLAAEGLATRPGHLAPDALVALDARPNLYGLAALRDGAVEVQDEGSQLLGAIVGARPGEAVLDACAGAGGKALLLAAAVGRTGRVHAADPDAGKLARLEVRARRAGAEEIVVVHGAAAAPELRVDRALVDAPCSELGALRRGPDLRWRLDPASFAPLPALQREILSRAARHVRPGGRLVYATCTFRRAEDEDVALAFEGDHPAFERVAPEADPSVVTPEGFLRTWPHRHGTDGFFAAVWTRR